MKSQILALWMVGTCLVGNLACTWAQDPPPDDKKKKAPEIVIGVDGIDAQARKDLEIPAPANVSLNTKDGVKINATYFGGLLGKKTPALILIHDLGGSADDLNALAAWLQSNYGYASIVPDLRGHGKSVSDDRELNPERMNGTVFASIANDIEACKIYLRDKNNEGLLNIDLLMVVAVGKSAILAVEWTALDWSYPIVKGNKQGQDVKALVLISPEQSYRGVKMASLKSPLFNGKDLDPAQDKALPVLIAVGTEDRHLVREAEQIDEQLKRFRKTDGGDVEAYLLKENKDNGAKIAQPGSGDLPKIIAEFVFYKLYQKAGDYAWQTRGLK